MNPLIEINQLSFKYHKSNNIFDNLDFNLCKGEVVGLKGSSGCGKTTFCNVLCGIIPNIYPGIVEGEIMIDGKSSKHMSMAEISTHVGIVFQEAKNQFFAPTLEENLAFAPENLKLSSVEIEKRIVEALDLVNLSEYRYFSPHKLSGGQQHLAALASLITLDPQVIILDEVMASLDKNSSELVLDIIKRFKSMGKAVIVVEHNDLALKCCDRVLKYENKRWEVQ